MMEQQEHGRSDIHAVQSHNQSGPKQRQRWHDMDQRKCNPGYLLNHLNVSKEVIRSKDEDAGS